MNKHREIIYKKRRTFLENPKSQIPNPNKIPNPNYQKEILQKEKELGEEAFEQVCRFVGLRVIDTLWQDHLSYMDHVRDSVRLRAYAGRDPLVEYKNEGHKAFGQLLQMLDASIAENILKAGIAKKSQIPNPKSQTNPKFQIKNSKIGRNDPCPCGAKHPDGRPMKYKHCHGKN